MGVAKICYIWSNCEIVHIHLVFRCVQKPLEGSRHVTITALHSSREEVQIIPPCFWKKPSYYSGIYDPLAEIDDDSQTTIVCSHAQAGKILYVPYNMDRQVFRQSSNQRAYRMRGSHLPSIEVQPSLRNCASMIHRMSLCHHSIVGRAPQ